MRKKDLKALLKYQSNFIKILTDNNYIEVGSVYINKDLPNVASLLNGVPVTKTSKYDVSYVHQGKEFAVTRIDFLSRFELHKDEMTTRHSLFYKALKRGMNK